MKNFVQPGETLSLIAPYAVASGAGFQVGRIFAVASGAAAIGAAVEGVTEGVFTLAKADEEAWTVGAAIYWDNSAKECTVTDGGTMLLIGVAAEALADTAGIVTGKVRLIPTAFITAAA